MGERFWAFGIHVRLIASLLAGGDQHVHPFTQQSIKDGCEGLMIKTLEQNASYEPSKRSLNWLKVGVSICNSFKFLFSRTSPCVAQERLHRWMW